MCCVRHNFTHDRERSAVTLVTMAPKERDHPHTYPEDLFQVVESEKVGIALRRAIYLSGVNESFFTVRTSGLDMHSVAEHP